MIKDVIGITKILIGALASVLFFCGIHWLAILAGVILGICYFAIPRQYLQ